MILNSDLIFIKVTSTDRNVKVFFKALEADIDFYNKTTMPYIDIESVEQTISTDGEIYLIQYKNKFIGFIEFILSGGYYKNMAWLRSLYIIPEYRSLGFGVKAVEFFKATALSNKYIKYLSVDCHPINEDFYEKCGFNKSIHVTKTLEVFSDN